MSKSGLTGAAGVKQAKNLPKSISSGFRDVIRAATVPGTRNEEDVKKRNWFCDKYQTPSESKLKTQITTLTVAEKCSLLQSFLWKKLLKENEFIHLGIFSHSSRATYKP